MTEIQNPKQLGSLAILRGYVIMFWSFEHLNFGFVSYFGFRASNFASYQRFPIFLKSTPMKMTNP